MIAVFEDSVWDGPNNRWILRDHIEEYILQHSPYSPFSLMETHSGKKPPKTHRVEQGDTYWSIARKYNVTVHQLEQWNPYEPEKIPIGANIIVSDPNNSKPDYEICMFCHPIENEVHKNNSFPNHQSEHINPNDGNMTGQYVDGIGGAFIAAEEISGNSRIGYYKTKGLKVYTKTPKGKVFLGNQFGKTRSLGKGFNKLGKTATGVSVVIYSVYIYNGVKQDGGRFGEHAEIATVRAGGGLAGAWAGASAGSELGIGIGMALGPEGGAVLGVVFGIVGGIAGGILGEDAAEYIHEITPKSNIEPERNIIFHKPML